MDDKWLAGRFEAERARLQGVAYRLLGSADEADDAVQETWLRLNRSSPGDIENMGAWLTTVVARVCLDMLRSRKARREEPLTVEGDSIPDAADPERDAMLAESVGLAMLTVLQRLAPAERVAFVLRDVFGVSFGEIAGIIGRSPVAARQLASRGRRRVQGASDEGSAPDVQRHREIVMAFFRASRTGDLQALLAVLDPDVSLEMDETALQMGTRSGWITSGVRGADAVAKQFAGQAQGVQVAIIDGVPGGVWMAGGEPRMVFAFTIRDGKVLGIELAADRERLRGLDIEVMAAEE
jgi:RNA polymerase sigma-70 factor (ECF subfamily)